MTVSAHQLLSSPLFFLWSITGHWGAEENDSGPARLNCPFFSFPIYFYYSFFLSLITHVLYGTVSLSVIFVWKKMSTRNLLSYPYHRHALATLLWPFACHTMSCNIFTCRPKKTFSARPCLSEYKPYNNIQHYRCDRLDPFFFFSSLINDFSNMLIFSISFCTEGSFVFFPFWML